MHNHNDTIIKTSEDFLKKYTSHFILRCACERELETEQRLQYIDPYSYGHQRCVFLVLLMLNRRPGGSAFCWVLAFSTTSCHQRVSKLTGGPKGPFCRVVAFPTTSVLKLTDIMSSPSYIIVQSPTQSLEWHIWSSSSGNNCHAVHRSLSSGASVYECTMGFLPCPIFSAKPTYAISSHYSHRNVSLPSGTSLWNCMFGRVEGQYTTTEDCWE